MENRVESFVLEFFKGIKSEIKREGNRFIISRVPKSFEDIFGKDSPYLISFFESCEGVEFAGGRFARIA